MTIHLAALTALSYYVKSASKEPAAPFLRPGPQKSWLSHEPDMPTNVGPLRWKWWKARHVTAKLRCSKAFSGWLMLAYVGFCEALMTTSMPSSTPSTESLSTKLAKQAYATYPEKPQNPHPKLRSWASGRFAKTTDIPLWLDGMTCVSAQQTEVPWSSNFAHELNFKRLPWPAMTCHKLYTCHTLCHYITIYYLYCSICSQVFWLDDTWHESGLTHSLRDQRFLQPYSGCE